MYNLYIVGDRTEPWSTIACIYLVVNISPSTQTPNFNCERNYIYISSKLLSPRYNAGLGHGELN
jgi:hypothetical protein